MISAKEAYDYTLATKQEDKVAKEIEKQLKRIEYDIKYNMSHGLFSCKWVTYNLFNYKIPKVVKEELEKSGYIVKETSGLGPGNYQFDISWNDARSVCNRFLSLWDCTEGKPISEPPHVPYEYKKGDYYRLTNIPCRISPFKYTQIKLPCGKAYTGDMKLDIVTGDTFDRSCGYTWIFNGETWNLSDEWEKAEYNRLKEKYEAQENEKV